MKGRSGEQTQLHNKMTILLSIGILAELLIFLANVCVTMPYDMGETVKWLMDHVGTGVALHLLLVLIPVAIFVLFQLSLMIMGQMLLKVEKQVRLQKCLEIVFWGDLLLLFGDERRWALSYQMLHGLCSIRGLRFVLPVMGVMLIAAMAAKRIWKKQAAVTLGIVLLLLMIYCKFTGFLGLPAKILYVSLYYVTVFGIVILTDRLEKKQQMTFCIGVFVVIWFCGQFVFSNGTHIHLSHRDEKLSQIMEMFAIIEEKEENNLPMIAGNNGGLKLIMAYNTDIEIPYDPNEMAAAKWSRQQYDDAMITMYNAADFGEYGLGALISYAQQKGCRYILLADEESWIANNMIAGGYALLYETEDMMLFYK